MMEYYQTVLKIIESHQLAMEYLKENKCKECYIENEEKLLEAFQEILEILAKCKQDQ